jgi:hypothetical protein
VYSVSSIGGTSRSAGLAMKPSKRASAQESRISGPSCKEGVDRGASERRRERERERERERGKRGRDQLRRFSARHPNWALSGTALLRETFSFVKLIPERDNAQVRIREIE